MKVTHAVWEQKNLGVNAYEIRLENEDDWETFLQAKSEVTEQGCEYLVVKTPVGIPKFLFQLQQAGLSFVETEFHVSLKKSEYHFPSFLNRFDRDCTVQRVTDPQALQKAYDKIRQGVFSTDRISMDPAFGPEKAANRYANWTEQMIEKGDLYFEICLKGEPFAFFTMHGFDASTAQPTLMGTYPDYLDKGLGVVVQKKCLDTAFELGYTHLKSIIVSNNPKVVRTNLMFGIIIEEMYYTYVMHTHKT